ncbi:MAG: TonB-dependent receptor [Acidobacteriota bacterium]
MNRFVKFGVAAGLAVFLFSTGTAYSQTGAGTFGTILGTVSDETGAVLPKVSVTVTNEKTGLVRTVATNEQGSFQVPALLPGIYRVELEASGFKKHQQGGVELRVNESVRVDVTMQIGELTQTIEVEGGAPLLTTSSGTVGHVIENKSIVELPLNGRDFTQLTLLVPGATGGNNPGGFFVIGGNNVSVTGNRSDSNNYTLDGVDNNENFFKFHGIKPSIDAVEEFKIQTNITSAQFGAAAGANVNVATRSGSNEIHGTAFEFLRNNVLDSREVFASTRPQFRFNDFGGTIGGPIKKDKTFWMFNYEGTRTRREQTILGTVPTPAMLGGDLSLNVEGAPAPIIYDPATTRMENGVLVRDPFPGNRIPSNRINPITKAYLDIFYTPLQPNRTGAFNLINNKPNALDTDQFTVRVDHRFSANTSVFGRFSLSDLTLTEPQTLPTNTRERFNTFRNIGVTVTHLFTPTTILDVRYGYNRNNIAFGTPNLSLTGPLVSAGLTGIPDKFRDYDYPINLDFSGFSGVGNFAFQNGPDVNHQFLPNLLMIRGKHTISVGADIKHEQIFHDGVFSNWAFTNVPTADPQNVGNTGQGLASFLLGLPSTASRLLGDPSLDASRYLVHYYVQDDIKLTPKLTLNLGLRYEDSHWFHHNEGRLSGYDTETGTYMWASTNPITGQPANVPRTLVDPDRNNFAPRFGLAYLLTPKTTVRAGYGIFYNSNFTWETSSARGNWPYSVSQSKEGMNRDFPDTPVSNVFPGTLDLATVPPDVQHSMSRHQRVGYMQQWNLHVQRELSTGLVLEVGYVGTKGTKLSSFFNANVATPGPGPVQPRRPFQNVGGFSEDKSIANSSYHGGTIKLEKRLSNNVNFVANYSYSRFIDLCSVFGCASPQNSFNIKADYGPSDLHNKHIFSWGYVTNLPFGPGQRWGSDLKGVSAAVVGGWQVNGITTMRSGRPFNVVLNFDNQNDGQRSQHQRPNVIRDPQPSGFNGTQGKWFDTSAFAIPTPFTYGNLGRNALYGPGLQTWDFGLFKNIPVSEGTRLQFRAEMFNAFNNVNFANPNASIGQQGADTPGFGQISGVATNQRQIQFGLKYIF